MCFNRLSLLPHTSLTFITFNIYGYFDSFVSLEISKSLCFDSPTGSGGGVYLFIYLYIVVVVVVVMIGVFDVFCLPNRRWW